MTMKYTSQYPNLPERTLAKFRCISIWTQYCN